MLIPQQQRDHAINKAENPVSVTVGVERYNAVKVSGLR
jgi:hypothetical protein